jgi:omega-amidase
MSSDRLHRLNRLTVSLAQMDCRLGEPEANEERAEDLIREAAQRGSDLVLLPELWRSGFDLANAERYAAPLGSGPFAWVAERARHHGLWIAGSLLEARFGQVCNTATLYSPQGELAAVYRKVHLFRLMDEHLYLTAGDRAPVFELPWGPCALGICYDLRFPELFRHYALEGAVLVLLPAQWPRRRVDALRALLRARAAENQCFMLGCNRVGKNGDTPFAGHSAMIDPWGNVILEGGETELLLTADLDLTQVGEVREHFPSFQDRRPDIYGMSR